MKRMFLTSSILLLLLPMSVLAIGGQEDPQLDASSARIFRSDAGEALTPASRASHADIVASFLQSRGRSAKAIDSLAAVSENRVERTGVTHHRLEQKADGLTVYGAYSKIAIDSDGRVINAIDRLYDVSGPVRPARIREDKAFEIVFQKLYGDDRPAFHQAPSIERVAVPMNDGTLREGFLVETWTAEDNQLHHTLVSGIGQVLNIELRTASDSYNVFTDNPNDTPQSLESGPGAGNSESPAGWLFTSGQSTLDISGNNVNAYLDKDANNASDGGGTSVTNGNFTTTANLSETPESATNKAVAVQNLFYLNNVMHDKLYKHGFVESARNFQEDNFGNGGIGGDSVNAEAQDGSGTDNANFSTPTDGSNPRMQMYLFTGAGDHIVVAGGSTYLAMGAEFGPALDTTGVTATIEYANDNTAPATDGCETITNSLAGKIALIDRGTCAFVDKVGNAQAAGAIGVIVINNAGDSILAMGGTDNTITIPSVFVGQSSGATIAGNSSATIALNPDQPLMKDGDLDSDIVFHEYGHGLTWRMIGSMSGPMAGAIGEGMGDVLSILMNNRDTVGTYATGDSRGIRRNPYTNYPLTYSGFTGSEVHDDGEIYAAAVWNVWQVFQANGVSKDELFDYLIDGMNYTPAGPTMEQMRDGILTSAANFGRGHECLIWEGFAGYGIGVGAKASVKGRRITVTESFAVPASCTGGGTAPTASFTWSASGLTVNFTDTSSGATSWSWTFGDGATSSAANPSHTYAAANTYPVTLTVSNEFGSDTASQSVTVIDNSGGGITLTASGYKVKGVQHAQLNWSGASSVNVTRDGQFIASVSGTSYIDNIGNKGPGSYTYQVCSGSTCSDPVQVNF